MPMTGRRSRQSDQQEPGVTSRTSQRHRRLDRPEMTCHRFVPAHGDHYSANRSSAIVPLAAASPKGKKSRGPGLLLPEVTAAPTSRPATPPAADIPLRTLALSLV